MTPHSVLKEKRPVANVASTEKKAQRKAEIIEAATLVFASKGFHKAGIADIAAELNIGHGTIYRYFKNKRDIFNAIVTNGAMKIIAVIAAHPPQADSFEEYMRQLKHISEGFTEVFNDNPQLARIIIEQTSAVDPQTAKRLKNTIIAGTQAYFKNGVDKCFLRQSMNQKIAAHMVTAMMYEFIEQLIEKESNGASTNMEEWANELLSIMINGISL